MSADTTTEERPDQAEAADEAVEPVTVTRPSDHGLGRIAWLSLVVTLIPLLVAAVRAIRWGWTPVGDSALIAIRSHDVLGGGQLPRLGMWSSSSWATGVDFNHPGPLLYDLLAVPTALFPGGTGQVVGATTIAAASILGIFFVARRRGGPLLALAAMAVTAALCWSMGSAVLIEPWHANTLVLPFLCFLILVWSISCGDRWCLPWAVFLGSLLLQTNLAYIVLVPGLLASALVIQALAARRQRASEQSQARGVRVGLVAAAAAVALLCWAQPMAEQLFGSGRGNLSRIGDSVGETIATLNWHESLQAVAKILVLPPWWGRPSYAEAFTFRAFGNSLPSLVGALTALVVLMAMLVVGLRVARRRGDNLVGPLLAIAIVLVGLALLTANLTPTDPLTGTVAYQLRWLWPIGAFVWFGLLVALLRRFVPDRRPAFGASLTLTLVTLVVAGLNLPWTNQGTTAPDSTLPIARDLVRAIDYSAIDGPVLVECGENVWDPYCEAVMAEADRRGLQLRVRTELGVRQLGEQRRWDGSNAVTVLRVIAGDWALLPPAGTRQLAAHMGIDEDARLVLLGLQADIKSALSSGEITLNDQGERLAKAGGLESVPRHSYPPEIDVETVAELRRETFGTYTRDLVLMIREHLLAAPDSWTERLERYAELQDTWDINTVAVFVQPLTPALGEELGHP